MAAAHIFGWLSRQVYTEMKNLFPYKCFSTIPFPEIWLASITPAIHPSLGSWQKMCVCALFWANYTQRWPSMAINQRFIERYQKGWKKSAISPSKPDVLSDLFNKTGVEVIDKREHFLINERKVNNRIKNQVEQRTKSSFGRDLSSLIFIFR